MVSAFCEHLRWWRVVQSKEILEKIFRSGKEAVKICTPTCKTKHHTCLTPGKWSSQFFWQETVVDLTNGTRVYICQFKRRRHMAPEWYAIRVRGCSFLGRGGGGWLAENEAWNRLKRTNLPSFLQKRINQQTCYIVEQSFFISTHNFGQRKILYYREILVMDNLKKKRWIPLVLPSPVIWSIFFFLSRITC